MLLTLALTILLPLPAPALADLSADERIGDETAYEALLDEYEDTYDVWREELQAAEDSKGRRAVRKRHPAPIFRPRFEGLADAGSGRSLVWLITNASKLEKRKQAAGLKAGCYERLWASHLDAKWFGEVITMYTKERRDVDALTIEATLADALERVEGDARARVLLGLARYRLAGKCNSGLEFYKQVLEEHPDSAAAKVAQVEYDRLTKFAIGAVPPEFKGKTIDGEEITLYGHRGKVTVVDFWGFW